MVVYWDVKWHIHLSMTNWFIRYTHPNISHVDILADGRYAKYKVNILSTIQKKLHMTAEPAQM
jgi:hypothetical protein